MFITLFTKARQLTSSAFNYTWTHPLYVMLLLPYYNPSLFPYSSIQLTLPNNLTHVPSFSCVMFTEYL